MKYLLTALLLFAAGLLQAQPTLHDIENYSAGSHSVYKVADASSFEPGATGANVTWDFSNIAITQDTVKQWIVRAKETSYAQDFPEATLVEKNSDSTFVYFTNDNDQFKLVGYVDQNSALKIHYLKSPIYIQRPAAYGDSVRSPFRNSYSLMGATVTGSGTSTTRADGYGTLKLPGKTYTDVLRLRIEQAHVDTVAGQTTNTKVITYVWFDANHRAALLKYDSTYVHSDFFSQTTTDLNVLQTEYINTSIASYSEKTLFSAEATMEGKLILHNSQQGLLTVDLYTLEGQHLQSNTYTLGADQTQSINLRTSLRPGLYLARIGNGRQVITQKVFINQ